MDNGAQHYRRFLAGDNDALVEIIRDYKDGLMFFINGFVGDLNAEELMEDTFVRLYTKKPKFSGRSCFKTWLYAIGRNVAREHINRYSKKDVPLEKTSNIIDDSYDPEASFFREEKYSVLYRAMSRLKPEYHQTLYLYYFEDLRSKDISVIIKKSQNNVNVMLHRAKQALREEMKKEGYFDENLY